ncbi:hypothetical protein [Nocardioides acrostichi]|uniref:Uncharacterized protein n=1 Tax=Nocardioides acrostichi TaxID=2784339 RepID=A0A930Y9M4_9ACTN|nr:hypothetical protein [Nocardioides acrostichi]MBF4160523.1 hypothetical protein [Nocardioides acrostichi]
MTPERPAVTMMGPLPRLHRTVMFCCLVALGALLGAASGLGAPGLSVGWGAVGGACLGSLLFMAAVGDPLRRAPGRS